jgi:hypothetical protein
MTEKASYFNGVSAVILSDRRERRISKPRTTPRDSSSAYGLLRMTAGRRGAARCAPQQERKP